MSPAGNQIARAGNLQDTIRKAGLCRNGKPLPLLMACRLRKPPYSRPFVLALILQSNSQVAADRLEFPFMTFSIDEYFGIHQQAMSVRSQRNTVIANNIANADTPGFKARDFDFKAALAEAGGQSFGAEQVTVTHERHLGGGDGPGSAGPLLYRVPMQPAQDGNTVETDREQAVFAENSVRYQASLHFLNGRIQTMVNVLKGGNN